MAELSNAEKRAFERLLEMGGGYVLDFSNRTFSEFVMDSTGREIYDARYSYASGSKANRLRGFWNEKPNHVVVKLLGDLLDYAQERGAGERLEAQLTACRRAVDRLRQSQLVPDIVALVPETAEQEFEGITRQVREAIEKNQPDADLDRLHTFTVKFVRTLCANRRIAATRDKALHGLFGEYVKSLKVEGLDRAHPEEQHLDPGGFQPGQERQEFRTRQPSPELRRKSSDL